MSAPGGGAAKAEAVISRQPPINRIRVTILPSPDFIGPVAAGILRKRRLKVFGSEP
jgi:hypothetical protein